MTRAGRASAAGLRHSQALASLRTAALENEAAILGFHADEEAVRLAATAPIGLISALHGCRYLREKETMIVDVARRAVNRERMKDPCRAGRTTLVARRESVFGPKISTTVEIIVENGTFAPALRGERRNRA